MKSEALSVVHVTAELPRADEAETSVLGAVLVENAALFKVADRLKPEHFGQRWCGLVYAAMLALAAQNKPVDFVTVTNALTAAVLEEVGTARLGHLTDGVPRSTNIEYYADIVIDRARLRFTVQEARRAIDDAVLSGDDAQAVIARAQEAFFRLASTRRVETLWSAHDMTTALFSRLEALEAGGYALTGLATGIHELDAITNGLQPGELVVMGARPSVGKTALVLQIAISMAQQYPGLFCSLEMGQASVWDRALFNLARVDGFNFKRGRLAGDPTAHRRIALALNHLSPLQLWLDEQPGMSSMDVRAKAQQVQLAHGLKFIVVDYLQLMRVADPRSVKGQNRAQIVGDMAKDLKEIARGLNVVVILLSQLNRAADDKDRPSMSNLRESGDIEAHADIIILLHRKETREQLEDLPVGEPSHVEMLLEKQRGNPTGIIQLLNYREQFRYASATRGDLDLLEQMEAAS